MKFTKPGDLIKASRDPKMKRSVMKAIGMPMKKKAKKASTELVKAPNSRYVRKTAKKGTMSMVKSPKANMKLRTKKAKKGVSGKSFGDEKIQGAKMERRGEEAKHFKSAKKA